MSNAVTTNEVSETEAVGQAVQFLNAHAGPVSPTLHDVANAAGMGDRPFAFYLAFVRATGLAPSAYWRKARKLTAAPTA